MSEYRKEFWRLKAQFFNGMGLVFLGVGGFGPALSIIFSVAEGDFDEFRRAFFVGSALFSIGIAASFFFHLLAIRCLKKAFPER